MNSILTLAFVAGIICPETKIQNRTQEWNDQDKQALTTAKRRCGEMYPEAPCVKMFRKADEGIYSAICGGNIKAWTSN